MFFFGLFFGCVSHPVSKRSWQGFTAAGRRSRESPWQKPPSGSPSLKWTLTSPALTGCDNVFLCHQLSSLLSLAPCDEGTRSYELSEPLPSVADLLSFCHFFPFIITTVYRSVYYLSHSDVSFCCSLLRTCHSE